MIVCAICGKTICRSEKTIGLLAMHNKKTNHQKILNELNKKKYRVEGV